MKSALAILVLVVSIGAAEDRQFRSVYRAPASEATTFVGKKVAALVITDDDSLRMSAEEALVRVLAGRKIQAVAAWRTIPREQLRQADQAKRWFDQNGVVGVVALRPVRLERTTTTYSPGWTTDYYSSFTGYYGYGWGSVSTYTPGGKVTDTYVSVEVAVYDLPRDKLLFGAVSDASNPKDMDTYMKNLVGDAVKQLEKAGLIAK